MVRFFVATIFPQVISCYCDYGMVRQAVKKGKIQVVVLDLREFADRGQVDDEAYGGVPGMVLKPEPIFRAYDHVVEGYGRPFVVVTEPWGRRIDQRLFEELRSKERILIVCGRYEGVDERVKAIADLEVSLGDFVLSGGEIVALALIEGVARTIPGVLSEPESLREDSFSGRWLGYPVYTRPREFRGMKVPEVLLSGNHRLIELWKLWHRIENTLRKRPDLIPEDLTDLERDMLESIRRGASFEEWVRSRRETS
jgi:tRNA (guanine37-N1)-methyltransferase